MAPRIWMTRFLCRNKAYHRVLTADCCPPLGCPPPPLGCALPPGYFTPQSVEDGQRIFPKLDWMRYWLSVGAQSSSNLNLKRIRTEECDSKTLLNSAAEECSDYSDGPNGHKAHEVVSARTAGPVIRSSSGHGALLLLQKSRTSSSAGHPFTRSFASNGTPSDSQLSDQEDKKLSSFLVSNGTPSDSQLSDQEDKKLSSFLVSNGTPSDSQLSDQEDKKLSSFLVIRGDNESLLRRIDAAIHSKKHEFTTDAMKERWQKHVRPQLSSRGLIVPESLTRDSTKFIHFRTKEIFGRKPQYMSSLDVMGHEKRMMQDEWQQFLVYMMEARIYVIEKWGPSISHVESLMYDFGIIGPDDGTNVEFYKGECDAAFHKDRMEAVLAFLILKGTGIIHCQVHYGVPCESSVVAEAYAAAALLMTSRDKGIKKLVLWTDCEATQGCLSGERNMNLEDENLGVFMMLREEKKCFDRVVPMWKGRELNQFAHDLVTLDKEVTLHSSFPLQAMNQWKHQLEGGPVFRFKQKNDVANVLKDFADVKSFGRAPATSAVFLDVEQVSKVDCLLGLQDGFKPDDLYIAVGDFSKKPQDLQLKIIELFGKPVEIFGIAGVKPVEGVTYFHKFGDTSTTKRQGERKSIMVLFDASLWGKPFHKSQLTVVLMSPGDAQSTDTRSLRKITALHYVQFSRIK